MNGDAETRVDSAASAPRKRRCVRLELLQPAAARFSCLTTTTASFQALRLR
jgi:hypothetical protein